MSVISEITEAITGTVVAKCNATGTKGFTRPQLQGWVSDAMMFAGYSTTAAFGVTSHLIATGALGDLYHWDTKDGSRRGMVRHFRIQVVDHPMKENENDMSITEEIDEITDPRVLNEARIWIEAGVDIMPAGDELAEYIAGCDLNPNGDPAQDALLAGEYVAMADGRAVTVTFDDAVRAAMYQAIAARAAEDDA